MRKPKVSVVISAYNQAQYLVEAIESVLRQTYSDFEVIIVDDGSTDSTPEVAKGFGGAVHYVRQENRGLSGARNTGIAEAQGDYVALLDADDYWEPDFLSAVVQGLESDSGLGAIHTCLRFVDWQGKVLPQCSTEVVPDDQMYNRLVDGEFFAADAVLVRRQCFDRVGVFDEALRASEDWDMWLRVSQEYRFGGIRKPLLNYRMHGENMSADVERMLRYQLVVAEKHFGSAIGPCTSWPQNRRRCYAAVYRQAALGYFLDGDAEHAQDYLHRALDAYPLLTESISLFYELGCADQPLGLRGDLDHLKFERNAALLLSSLNSILGRQDLSPNLSSRKQTAFAHAYLALGILAYGSGRFSLARGYLSRALLSDLRLARNRQLWSTFGRTLLNRQLGGIRKAYRSALSGTSNRM